MAYVAPTVRSVGDAVTAADYNVLVGNDIALPRGYVAQATSSATTAVTTTEVVAMTTGSFTAEAGRRYLVTYMEPGIGPTGAVGAVIINLRIRLTNVLGTQLGFGNFPDIGGGSNTTCTASGLVTLSAGATTICGTASISTGSANRGGGLLAYLIVEDVGAV